MLLVLGVVASLGTELVTASAPARAGEAQSAAAVAAHTAAARTVPARTSPARARTIPARPVDLALVLPKGVLDAGGLSPAAVRAQVAAASSYWSTQTAGLVRFQVVATQGWYRSGLPCSNGRGIWAEAAARFGGSQGVGMAATSGRHLVIVVPPARAAAAGCGYGFGTQGEVPAGTASVRGSGVATGGGTVFITNAAPSLLAHELGHNLGLDHAGSLTCVGAQDGRFGSGGWPRGCVVREYDDLYDVMGYSSPGYGEGNLNAAHLDQLGLDPAAVRTASTGVGAYRLPPLSALDAPGRAVKIVDPTGAVYYLEYRTATGRDLAATRTALRARPGLRILRTDPRLAGATLELDATPPARVGGAPAPADYDRALPVDGVFTAASGQVAVRLEGASSAAATVRVSVGPNAAATLGTTLRSVRTTAVTRVVPRLVAGAPRVVAAGRRFAVGVSVRASVTTGSRWALMLQRQAAGRWRNVTRALTTPTARGGARAATLVRQVRGRASYRWVVTGLVPAGARKAVPPAGRARISPVVVVTAR